LYFGISGPTSFGTGNFTPVSSESGQFAGIIDGITIGSLSGAVLVPDGYTSGSTLTSSATWDSTTISGLGLTPGTYIYTWGSVANGTADSLVVEISSPEPSSLILLGMGGVGLLGYGWRRRRKSV
jgi:hypothetical protein